MASMISLPHLFGAPANQADPPRAGDRSGQEQTRQEPALTSKEHWLDKFARLTTIKPSPPPNSLGHATVLHAFRDVVDIAAESTVRMICRGKPVALGTIIDADGLIVTKDSELSGPVICELHDGRRYDAKRVATDRPSDITLLKIPVEGLTPIQWAEDDPPSVGGWVVTPGMGELPLAVGIVSVVAHEVRGGVLGIQLTEDAAGPRVTFVVPQSGADKAGLRPGDVVTHIGSDVMKNADDVIAKTSRALPGDRIQVALLRHGQRQSVTATLGSVFDTLSSRRAQFQDQLGGALSKRRTLFPSALEHDSDLKPAQCGGPLVNLDGQAVGINIARVNRIASYAIPATVVRPLLEALKSQGLTPVSHEVNNGRMAHPAPEPSAATES